MTSREARYSRDFIRSKNRQAAALERAWETRNFEIELYWKRATYFWTMIGALFAGYALSMSPKGDPNVAFILSCVGLIISTAWYFINRASSAWQRNWEAHIDALEDNITGPLYKSVYAPKKAYKYHDLFGPLPMSPSKIAVAVSLFVACTWIILIVYNLPSNWNPIPPLRHLDIRFAVLSGTVVCCLALTFLCRTGGGNYKLGFRKRRAKW